MIHAEKLKGRLCFVISLNSCGSIHYLTERTDAY